MQKRRAFAFAGYALSFTLAGSAAAQAGDTPPHHQLPASPSGNLVVGLCDGETSVEVPGVRPGDSLTREQAQQVADQLMQAWRHKHPDANWVVAQNAAGTPTPEVNPSTQATPQAQTYGAFTQRDFDIWRASTEQLVAEGKRIFHSSKELGSNDAISCDMCHPDAANTHPETYPKFQVQLGRVVLLRDMINWCIENPVRGKPLADDDPKLKALEAYILAQRKGTPLDYGKH
jgi:thiosulfate dehydrogenase